MIYKQCNYYILLLLCDFEWQIVDIKQTWKLELEKEKRWRISANICHN